MLMYTRRNLPLLNEASHKECKRLKTLFNFKSIRIKVLFGFLLVLLFVIALGVTSTLSVNNINNNTKQIVNEDLPVLIALDNSALNTVQRLASARAYVLYGDTFYKDEFMRYTEEAKELQEQIQNDIDSEEFRQQIFRSVEWREIIIGEVFYEYDRGNTDVAQQILGEKVAPISNEIIRVYEELTTGIEAHIKSQGEETIKSGELTTLLVVAVAIGATILGLVISFITSQSITKPIRVVMERMNLIADGDLSNDPLETKLRDEVGQLIVSTNEMSEKTRSLLHQINDVSQTVSSQSEELSQASNEVKVGSEQTVLTMEELATGAETQANNASELASIIGDFSAKVQEANANGEQIHEASTEVLALTNDGSQLMNSSTKQMEKIDQIVQDTVQKVKGLDVQSQEISKLVDVINDISGQTNLLALNAAIEAARAGEHGKGFAVVADEVKKLAEQVALSVADITDIVNNIQSEFRNVTASLQDGYLEVEKGTNQIEATGETFNKISMSVKDMVSNVQTISGLLSVMATNSHEINNSIEEIASISEESAAGVEQASAASQQASSTMEEVAGSSEQLATLAEELNGLVHRFKL